MPGWRWKNKQAPTATQSQALKAVAVPLVVAPQKLFAYFASLASPYGQSFHVGRSAYAEPPSATVMQTRFATIGQVSPENQVGPWIYSPGMPTVNTLFPVVGGLPPQGGYSTNSQVGSV
jgi:hypothetical protein